MLLNYKEFKPQISKGVWIAPSAQVIGRCEIGEDSSVWFGAVIRADINFIKIGDRTSIQDLSMIHVWHYTKADKSDGFPTIIGSDVTIGHKAMLHGCIINDACMIGMNATILDGAEISRESIVAAGSVVTQNKKFPPGSLIMGTPAKVVRNLTEKDIELIYYSSRNYVTYKNEYLKMSLKK